MKALWGVNVDAVPRPPPVVGYRNRSFQQEKHLLARAGGNLLRHGLEWLGLLKNSYQKVVS